MILAPITRSRPGTSEKVVSAVRWDHSLVTARMPSTGRISETTQIAPRNISARFWSSALPQIAVTVTITAASRPTISSSQKPARVSTILRSSTPDSVGRLGRVNAAGLVSV